MGLQWNIFIAIDDRDGDNIDAIIDNYCVVNLKHKIYSIITCQEF